MAEPRQVDLTGLQRDDHRGWSLNPILASGLAASSIGNLHVVSIKPGTSRGNHVHRDATEWLLVFGGAATIIWRSPAQPTPKKLHLDGPRPRLFEVPPKVEHSILNASKEDMYLVAFYDQPDPDTESCPTLVKQD